MMEARDGFGLGAKPAKLFGAQPFAAADHFERDETIKAQVPGFEDDSHRPAAEFGDDLIAANRSERLSQYVRLFEKSGLGRGPVAVRVVRDRASIVAIS